MNGRIFIVEDDAVIAGAIAKHLSKWDFEVRCAENLRSVMEEFSDFQPQLVILDITLPFYNGFYWCGEIRRVSGVPVLFLSSAGENMNIIMAMNMGGDDFITKPFDLDVLLAKVRSMMRRAYSLSGTQDIISHNGVVLNVSDSTVQYEGRRTELTKNEVRILTTLMENAGSIVSRDALMRRLWENESFVDDNTLTVNVTRLRRKLEDMGLSDFIVTHRGQGYMVV